MALVGFCKLPTKIESYMPDVLSGSEQSTATRGQCKVLQRVAASSGEVGKKSMTLILKRSSSTLEQVYYHIFLKRAIV